MSENDGRVGAFPANINKYTPRPEPDAVSITGLYKQSGKISGYQLSNGRRVGRDEGVRLAKQNKIKGVAVAENQGVEYLRALPDGQENNNLSNLPTVGIE